MPGISTGGGAAVAALRVEQPLHGGGREGVGGDAVDGVGGDDDELAACRSPAREPHAGEQLGRNGGVVSGHVGLNPSCRVSGILRVRKTGGP